MPRSRPRGDDSGLSPLPPLPPRELSRDTREGWDQTGHEEQVTGEEWDRARREEWDERDW
jgi:hypothetical protein